MGLFGKKKKEMKKVEGKSPANIQLAAMDSRTRAIADKLNQEAKTPKEQEPHLHGNIDLDVDINLESVEEMERKGKEQRVRFIKKNCDIIAESQSQIADSKLEYQEVTAYLKDIEEIEKIDGKDKEELLEAAGNILRLTKERAQYKSSTIEISDAQMHRLEPYDETLAEDVKKMFANESYQMALKQDMGYLEGEKYNLLQEQKETAAKQRYLKSLTAILIVLLISIFALLFVIQYLVKIDMIIPYLMTVAFVAVIAAYIFSQGMRNRRLVALNDRKLNKAVILLNRVKIKYVNTTNVLDYTRTKFGVESAAQFEFVYTEYVKAKEFAEKYKDNKEKMRENCSDLMKILNAYSIHDSEVWVHQVSALIDSRDMVEVRHRLNLRRQQIRERIAYNEGNKDKAYLELHQFMERFPKAKPEVAYILKKYNVLPG